MVYGAMAVEKDSNGGCEVVKGDLEGKSGLNLSFCDDLKKVDGDVNDLEEEICGEAKEVVERFDEVDAVSDSKGGSFEEKIVLEESVDSDNKEEHLKDEVLGGLEGVNGVFCNVEEEKIVLELIDDSGEEEKHEKDEILEGLEGVNVGSCNEEEEKTVLEVTDDSLGDEKCDKGEELGVEGGEDCDICTVEDKTVSESSVDSSEDEKQLEEEGWGIEEGEDGDSCRLQDSNVVLSGNEKQVKHRDVRVLESEDDSSCDVEGSFSSSEQGVTVECSDGHGSQSTVETINDLEHTDLGPMIMECSDGDSVEATSDVFEQTDAIAASEANQLDDPENVEINNLVTEAALIEGAETQVIFFGSIECKWNPIADVDKVAEKNKIGLSESPVGKSSDGLERELGLNMEMAVGGNLLEVEATDEVNASDGRNITVNCIADGKENGDAPHTFSSGVDVVLRDTSENNLSSNHVKDCMEYVKGELVIEDKAVFELNRSCIDGDPSVLNSPIGNVWTESDVSSGSTDGSTSEHASLAEDDTYVQSEVGIISSSTTRENLAESVSTVVDVENERDQCANSNSNVQEICTVECIEANESQPSFPEGSTTESLDGKKLNAEMEKTPLFCYLIKIPKYFDEKMVEKIAQEEQQVDEKTRIRDAIRAEIQTQRGTCNEYRDKFEAAKSEERVARDVLNAKRQEINSVQSMLNQIRNATSIEDISHRIRSIEYSMQHETMPLREEKKLMLEMKQLKLHREQLSSSMGKQAERQLTFDQRDKFEEQLKSLKKEADGIRKEILQIEEATKAARKMYFNENLKLRDMQAEFRAADALRQEAYRHLQNHRKQLYDKNTYFRIYKEDVRKAVDFACTRDREALHLLCVNQVENIMDLWNKNDDFRNAYVRCNKMSTVRRLGTLDGRSLGPDEDPPLLQRVGHEKAARTPLSSIKTDSTLPVSTLEMEDPVGRLETVHKEVEPLLKLEQKHSASKLRKGTETITAENSPDTVSDKEEAVEKAEANNKETEKEAVEKVEAKNKKTREEELARKAEELRREEAAAMLREQQLLEEKAKSKVAEDRKKRNAEKAQARAELKAQKEAELREKKREKKARKKTKKAAAVEATNDGIEAESSHPFSENAAPELTQEPETEEKPKAVSRRSPRPPSIIAKQNKLMPIPPPLRNMNKRKMQSWMWIVLATLVVITIYVGGKQMLLF